MNPPKRLTDPSFKYTGSDFTDIRATFARIRQQMESWEPIKTEQQPSNVAKLKTKGQSHDN